MDRDRFKTIAFKVGDGNKRNFIELSLEIEKKCGAIEYLCTDKNPSYGYYKLAHKQRPLHEPHEFRNNLDFL